MKEMPRPGDAHKKLEKFVGRWRGDEKMHPSPWDPAGGTALGRVDNRFALDGFVVLHDYEQERGGHVTFRGHAVIRWDAAAKSYVMHWFDTMDMPPNEFRGNFDGEVLTMVSKAPQGSSRAVFDFGQPGAYHFRMDVSPDGKQWQTFMEGQYTQVDRLPPRTARQSGQGVVPVGQPAGRPRAERAS